MPNEFQIAPFDDVMDTLLWSTPQQRNEFQVAEKVLPVVPDAVVMIDEFIAKSTRKTILADTIERNAFASEVLGESVELDPILPKPDPLMAQRALKSLRSTLRKSAGVTTVASLHEAVLHKSAGLTEGMQELYDLWFEKFDISERTMVEKAIKMLDINAFHTLIALAMGRD